MKYKQDKLEYLNSASHLIILFRGLFESVLQSISLFSAKKEWQKENVFI